MNIKFRENWNRGTVDVYEGDRVVYSDREYRGSAELMDQLHLRI